MKSALEFAKGYVGQRETGGKNRSPQIDKFNKFVHIPMGSPYCAAGISFCFDQAMDGGATGTKFPHTGGSQAVKSSFRSRGKLTTDPQALKTMKGALFGWTNSDGVHGHVGLISGRLTDANGKIVAIETVEFNSNSSGSRDGEGVCVNKRKVPMDRKHKLWFCDVSDVAGGDFGWKKLA